MPDETGFTLLLSAGVFNYFINQIHPAVGLRECGMKGNTTCEHYFAVNTIMRGRGFGKSRWYSHIYQASKSSRTQRRLQIGRKFPKSYRHYRLACGAPVALDEYFRGLEAPASTHRSSP